MHSLICFILNKENQYKNICQKAIVIDKHHETTAEVQTDKNKNG